MSKYQEFIQLIGEVDRRRRELSDDLNNLKLEISKIDEDMLCNEINREFEKNEKLLLERNMITGKIEAKEKRLSIYNTKGFDEKYINESKEIQTLSKQIKEENSFSLEEYRVNFDKKIEDLERIKKEYLSLVKEVGSISRQASIKAKEIMAVEKALTGRLTHYQGVNDDTNLSKGTGTIFIDVVQAYKE